MLNNSATANPRDSRVIMADGQDCGMNIHDPDADRWGWPLDYNGTAFGVDSNSDEKRKGPNTCVAFGPSSLVTPPGHFAMWPRGVARLAP
jgi:hypothetical protein